MKRFYLYFIFWAALCGAAPSHAAAPGPDEVKAAFLLNFARFVEWPAEAFGSSGAPITIGILGDADFGTTVAEIVDGKIVKGRSFAVELYARLGDVAGCQILFISASLREEFKAIAASLRGSSVFSMADAPGFARLGGVGNFKIVDNKVRFELNPGVASDGGLKISSQLLRLADLVE